MHRRKLRVVGKPWIVVQVMKHEALFQQVRSQLKYAIGTRRSPPAYSDLFVVVILQSHPDAVRETFRQGLDGEITCSSTLSQKTMC